MRPDPVREARASRPFRSRSGITVPPAGKAKIVHALILGLIFAAAAILRVAHLSADPPDNLSPSRAIYNDGGAYALNARCKLLTGHWIAPGDNVIAQTPGFSFLAYLAIRIMGLAPASLRALSVFGTLLALVLVVYETRPQWGCRASEVCAALLGFDFLFVMYGRLELIEGLLSGIAAAAMVAVARARSPGHETLLHQDVTGDPPIDSPALRRRAELGWTAAAATLIAAAMMIKPTAAIFLLPATGCLALPSPRSGAASRRGFDRSAIYRVGMLLLVAGFWLALYRLFFYLPHRDLFERFHVAFQQNASGLWDWRLPVVWRQVLAVGGIWGLVGTPLLALVIIGLAAEYRDRSDWGTVVGLWMLTGIVYLAPQTYRPNRFTILFVPPAAVLAARGAVWLWEKNVPMNPVAAAGWTIYLITASELKITYPVGSMLWTNTELSILFAALALAGAAASRRGIWPLSLNRAAAALLVAAVILFADLSPYSRWFAKPQYSLANAGGALRRILNGSPAAGDNWCSSLALFHMDPAYKIDWLPLSAAEMRRLRIRYLVYDARETRMLSLYGSLIRRSRPVSLLRVGHYTVKVLRLPG